MSSRTDPDIQPDTRPPAVTTDATVLSVEKLGKYFDIYPNDRARLYEFLGNREHHVRHWALRDISFQVEAGRAFGVIGANGAGKSTLLRLLAGISAPSEGRILHRGRIATLLDLGVSFHDTFTGRENIELNCALLGLSPEETQARIPEIIRFAELGAFIDHPVRTWSTGMNLRLGFSIAVHSSAELLLVDEVLAVGDQYFQRKCVRRIEELLRAGCALVLVSHDLHAVRHLCDAAAWIDQGHVRVMGDPREVVEHYLEPDRLKLAPPRPLLPGMGRARAPGDAPGDAPGAEVIDPGARAADAANAGNAANASTANAANASTANASTANASPGAAADRRTAPHRPAPASQWLEADPAVRARVEAACVVPDPAGLFEEAPGEAPRRMDGETPVVTGSGEIRILRVQLLDGEGNERARFRTFDDIIVAVTVRTTEPVDDPVFGIALFRDDGAYVFGPNTRYDGVLEGRWHGVYTWFLRYPAIPLLQGTYRISVAFFDQGHIRPLVWHNQLYELRITQDLEDHGLVHLPHRWGVLPWYER